MDEFVGQYNIQPENFFAAWAAAVWDGRVYAIPFYKDGRLIFWNKEIFAEIGLDAEAPFPAKDWEDMTDLAVQLTRSADNGSIEVICFVPSPGCLEAATAATTRMPGPTAGSS